MAGKEVSGFSHSDERLFTGASMLLVPDDSTPPELLSDLDRLFRALGFEKVVHTTPENHDQMIAYTSQLAHVVSNAYVKDGEIVGCLGFTGGSFQDMTRIAGVDEGVWSELYLLNKDNLSARIGALIENLAEIKSAIDGGDAEVLRGVLKEGRERFSQSKERAKTGGITLTYLK